ncbi:MAG: MlaD family protein [Alphaproteobacteria bacterium]|nr:MlaD family protein [Alphaproteobacteria bacterium]
MLKSINDFYLGIIFVAFVFILTICASNDVSNNSNNQYVANFESVDGIKVNTNIYMNGVEIGKVYSISLIDGFAKVSIVIDNTIKIPVDSTITVETNDLFSAKVLSILPGFEEEYMKDNDTFMMAQSSIDALGLLNSYLDIKVKEKKDKQQE